MGPLDPHELDRLLALVDQRGPEECWPFTGSVGTKGYGSFEVKRNGLWSGRTAHRVRLEHKLGRFLATEEHALHDRRCTTRLCCNPAHLRSGSHQDNMDDKVALGTVRGERNSQSKLTDEQRRAIVADPRTITVLGRVYGVSKQTISWVRKKWAVR